MIDPHKPIALLPQDREIMDITGLDEKSYREFVVQCYKASRFKPGEPLAFDLVTFAVSLIVGIALSYLSSLLTRTPQADDPKQRQDVGGQRRVNGDRTSPTSGFDSVQNVVELASVVPLVYANRREIDGNWFGGTRVNTSMLWSQLYSVGGGQMLRGIFLLSEGTVPQPDPAQIAIGNNLIANFDLERNSTSRVALYYVDGSNEDNRITSDDNFAGRLAPDDLGNAQNSGGSDVFQARTQDTQWASDFVSVITLSNQTEFGVSGFIGNNLSYRVNPRIQPVENYDEQPTKINAQSVTERSKDNKRYSGRSGVVADTSGVRELQVGDEVTYQLFRQSDALGRHNFISGGVEGESYCADIAGSVASRQNGYDDQIVVGDKYLIGTAQGICTERTNEPFNSEVVNTPIGGGNDVTAVFRITQSGEIHEWTEADLNPTTTPDIEPPGVSSVTATSHSHIMRLTEGYFATERASRFVEIGIRSNVQLNLNGICSFRDVAKDNAVRTYSTIDSDFRNDNIRFVNGTFTSPETRYSFFKISYRQVGEDEYTLIETLFSVRSMMNTPVYNYIHFDMLDENLWEYKITPVSGYEAVNSTLSITVIDYKLNNRIEVEDSTLGITISGVNNFARNSANFGVPTLTTIDNNSIGSNYGEALAFDQTNDGVNYYSEGFARIAEAFMHTEITTSATQPEHSIVYVNCQTSNPTEPNYANLAMLGMNIRSSREINQLQQLSVYCNQGIEIDGESTNNFPEILLDLLTNERYGTGSILNAEQIDTDSFTEAATWCEDRLYFFDGVLDNKINVRSWGAETAQNFLLDLVIRNGRFGLVPVCDFDDPVEITGLFTSGNILEDSFEFSVVPAENRIPPRISVRWRDERPNSEGGLFPVVRQITVREADTPEDAPLESIDISEYATSEKHAIDVAKYQCRTRRLITDTVSFTTTPTQAALDIGAAFKLGIETVTYDQPQNGAIAEDGAITSWPPLADGTYNVLIWDGTTSTVEEAEIEVRGNKTDRSNAVFCVRSTVGDTEVYRTQAVSYNEEGNLQVEATIYPTNEDGLSLIAEGWDTASNWVIEGQIYS